MKGTKHSPNVIEQLAPLPSNAFLVTSLYTNIPHKEGIAAMIHLMEKCRNLLPTNCLLSHIVRTILDFILKHSTFKVMDKHIHQILGTFMSTRMIPPAMPT